MQSRERARERERERERESEREKERKRERERFKPDRKHILTCLIILKSSPYGYIFIFFPICDNLPCLNHQ